MDFKLLFEDFPERIIPYDYEAYFSNPDKFVMVTTNCITGKAEYFEEKSSCSPETPYTTGPWISSKSWKMKEN